MSWTDTYFTSEWLERFHKETRRRFGHFDNLDVDDIASEAQRRLFERFQGIDEERLTPAYVLTAFRNHLEDIRRAIFGRVRPPTWIAELGEPYLSIFTFFCLDKLPPDEICRRLEVVIEILDAVTRRIRAEDNCPKEWHMVPVNPVDAFDDGSPEVVLPGQSSSDDDPLEAADLLSFLAVALEWGELDLDDNERDALLATTATAVSRKWLELRETIDISDQERIMLRLHYGEGLSARRVAEILGERDHNVRRAIKRACGRIGDVLQQHGISLEALL